MLIFSLVVLLLAVVFGVLGFIVLPTPRGGFAKVMFYVLIMLALITGFFGFMQATVH